MNKLTVYTATLLVVIFALIGAGCRRKGVKLQAEAVTDRAAMPVLDAKDVTTLISDSGVTRYRIITPHWQIFDRAEPSYWEFPEGIYLEKFNEQLEVDASLKSDYAYYNERAQIWTLTGNVHAKNTEGEQFDTPELNWNQNTERIYSDSTIKITRASSIIEGIGFNSNQTLTEYTILHPTGMFPIEE